MAGINAAQVYMPGPVQSTTVGAVAVADVGTTAPTDARTALPSADWTTGGYIGDAGIALSISRTFTTVKDWAQLPVRKALTEYDGTISIPWLQVDEFFANAAFGDANVTPTAADLTHGNILKIDVGSDLGEIKAWCFNMKDGDRRVRLYAPRAQITELGEIPFAPTGANTYPSTLSTYDDGTGHSIYLIYDDGQIASA